MPETHTHVAAIFSMKKRWLERNPEAARLRIRVTSKNSFGRIQNADSPQNVLPKKYRRWVKEDPTIPCASEIDAWEAAIQIRDVMIADGRKVDLNFGPANHRLYVIEMDAKVAEHKAFKKMNAMIADLGSRTCVYVGLTSQEITERYAQHRSTTHPASTQWGKRFFLEPFGKAFRGDLVEAFADAGNDVEALNKYQALRGELELRCWLQSRAAAAYSN
jgi:hypothetical protein